MADDELISTVDVPEISIVPASISKEFGASILVVVPEISNIVVALISTLFASKSNVCPVQFTVVVSSIADISNVEFDNEFTFTI